MTTENKIDSLTLDQKIFLITNEIPTIKKEGRNEFQKYKYLKESQANEILKPLLKKYKVGFKMLSAIAKQILDLNKQKLVEVECTFEFSNLSPEALNDKQKIIVYGHGADTSDKGIYKAITGARKYCLMQNFLISTGDDPEKENVNDFNWKKPSFPKKEVKKPNPKFPSTTDFPINYP